MVDTLRRQIEATDCDVRYSRAQSNEQIRDIYGAADFSALQACRTHPAGSRFGLVYLEAAAAGLPSVATAVGGVPDAVLADERNSRSTGCRSSCRRLPIRPRDSDQRAMLAAGASAHARSLSWEQCAAATYGPCPHR